MKRLWVADGLLLVVSTVLATTERSERVSKSLVDEKGCLFCHEGIERFTDGPMQDSIEALGEIYDDSGGCVVCHGGTARRQPWPSQHTMAYLGISWQPGDLKCFILIPGVFGLPKTPAVNVTKDMLAV